MKLTVISVDDYNTEPRQRRCTHRGNNDLRCGVNAEFLVNFLKTDGFPVHSPQTGAGTQVRLCATHARETVGAMLTYMSTPEVRS